MNIARIEDMLRQAGLKGETLDKLVVAVDDLAYDEYWRGRSECEH